MDVEADVTAKLAQLDAVCLESIMEILELPIKDESKGNRKILLRSILKYLNSEELEEEEDQGLSVFLHLNDVINRSMNSPEKKVRVSNSEHKFSPNFDELKTEPKSESVIDIKKIKDFKISGTIGGLQEKDRLSYSSLSYQIQTGLSLGYSSRDICAGVIKAISPSSNLRSYLESRQIVEIPVLLNILRSHYKEKDSASKFAELCSASQMPNESCQEFVRRLMCLRQKVLQLANEEHCPYDERMLQKRFLHAIETGIRNGNVRNELRPILKNEISDEELLEKITFAVSNEAERNEKFSNNKKKENPSIFKLENDSYTDNTLHSEIKELKLEQEKQMSAVRSEIQEIRKVMTNNSGYQYNRPQNRQFRPNASQIRNASLPPRAPQNQIFNLPQPQFTHQNFNNFYRPPFQPRNHLNVNHNQASGNNQTNSNSYQKLSQAPVYQPFQPTFPVNYTRPGSHLVNPNFLSSSNASVIPQPPNYPPPGLPPKVDNRNSCPSCIVNQVKCNHCFICGATNHFKSLCPYLTPNQKNGN